MVERDRCQSGDSRDQTAGAVLLGRAARLTVDDEVAVYFAEGDEREFGSEV
jgi:hypothetical protein